MRNFIHIIFEKYGMIKMFGSAILALIFYTLFYYTGLTLFKYIMIPFAVYFALLTVILFSYAYIINPYKAWKEKHKK
jgi:ATP/ADP translocase